jgi:hypothetical protein
MNPGATIHRGADAESESQMDFVSNDQRRVTVAPSPEAWDTVDVPLSRQEQKSLMPLALAIVEEVFGDDL